MTCWVKKGRTIHLLRSEECFILLRYQLAADPAAFLTSVQHRHSAICVGKPAGCAVGHSPSFATIRPTWSSCQWQPGLYRLDKNNIFKKHYLLLLSLYAKFWRARSRLFPSRFLQLNTHFAGSTCFEMIYKSYIYPFRRRQDARAQAARRTTRSWTNNSSASPALCIRGFQSLAWAGIKDWF